MTRSKIMGGRDEHHRSVSSLNTATAGANRLQRERPARIVAVEAAMRDAGILARCTTYLTREDILQWPQDYHAVHAPAYLQRLNRLSRWGGSCCSYTDTTGAQQQHRLDQEAAQYSSVFLTAERSIDQPPHRPTY